MILSSGSLSHLDMKQNQQNIPGSGERQVRAGKGKGVGLSKEDCRNLREMSGQACLLSDGRESSWRS